MKRLVLASSNLLIVLILAPSVAAAQQAPTIQYAVKFVCGKSEGKVVSLGSGKVLDSGKKQPFEVKEGDRVIFGRYSGDEILIDGKKHKVLKESEVLAVYSK